MALKKGIQWLAYFIFFIALILCGIDRWITYTTSSYIYTQIDKLPYRTIGVVLGTAKYVRGGGYNEYYKQRILGAAALYFAGKIDYLLVSGDNALPTYNEPVRMRKDLLKQGIPAAVIHLDYAGFRTLDSIVRAKKVFAAHNFTIITQKFHCERALFIARAEHIKAQCYAVPAPRDMKIMRLREIFARLGAFIDVYFLQKEPKFLGPRKPIFSQKMIKKPLILHYIAENSDNNCIFIHNSLKYKQ